MVQFVGGVLGRHEMGWISANLQRGFHVGRGGLSRSIENLSGVVNRPEVGHDKGPPDSWTCFINLSEN